MKINQRGAALLALIVIISFISIPVSAADQPYLKAALADLNKAQASLKRAANDRGGYSKKALNLVEKAISAVNAGTADDLKTNRLRQTTEFDKNVRVSPNNKFSDQSDLLAAKENLQRAFNNLEKATPDKGGFRVNAMNFVREAIIQINAGVRDPSV